MDSYKLASFIQEDYFIPSLKAKTKETVLKELVQPLVDHGNVKSQSLILETLLRRETLGSTGIGKGVAIPHCRTSVVTEIHIVVGLSINGIHFDSIDKKDVNIFFLIVAPPQEETNLYLPILGKLVEMVRNNRTRRALRKVENYQSLIKVIQGG